MVCVFHHLQCTSNTAKSVEYSWHGKPVQYVVIEMCLRSPVKTAVVVGNMHLEQDLGKQHYQQKSNLHIFAVDTARIEDDQ